MRKALAALLALICVSSAGVVLIAWTPKMPSVCAAHPALCRESPSLLPSAKSVPHASLRVVREPAEMANPDKIRGRESDHVPRAAVPARTRNWEEEGVTSREDDIETRLEDTQRSEFSLAPTSSVPEAHGSLQGGRALIFTMDSIKSYVQNSKHGGPAGEILVRRSLQEGLERLGIEPVVAEGDAQFHQLSASPDSFRYFFLDPWTFVGKDYRPRPFLVGREQSTFLLSFFGMQPYERHGLEIALDHVLTPYDSTPPSWENRWLGFIMPPAPPVPAEAFTDGNVHGVLWGKSASYLRTPAALAVINALSRQPNVVLHTTATGLRLRHVNIIHHSHLARGDWLALLGKAHFLVGLGDPVLGPTAVEAVSLGCLFLNPSFPRPRLASKETSQHSFLENRLDMNAIVCQYEEGNGNDAVRCLDRIPRRDGVFHRLQPHPIPEFQPDAYVRRLEAILHPE